MQGSSIYPSSPTGGHHPSGVPGIPVTHHSPSALTDGQPELSPLKQLQRLKSSGASGRTSNGRNRSNRACTLMIGYAPSSKHCIGTGQCGSRSSVPTPQSFIVRDDKDDSRITPTRIVSTKEDLKPDNQPQLASPVASPVPVLPSVVIRRPAPPNVPPRTTSVGPLSSERGSATDQIVQPPMLQKHRGSKSPEKSPCVTPTGKPIVPCLKQPASKSKASNDNRHSKQSPIIVIPPTTRQPLSVGFTDCSDAGENNKAVKESILDQTDYMRDSNTPLPKPTVAVKLLSPSRASCRKLLSKSLDNLDSVDQQLGETLSPFEQLDELRHTFLNKDIEVDYDTLNRQLFPRTFKESCTDIRSIKPEPIYSSVGNLNNINDETSRNSNKESSKPSPNTDTETYSLPEPQSYGEGTLKAVKRITDKYDSIQMRKLRARSFRAGSNVISSQDKNSLDRALLNLQVECLSVNDHTATSSAPCSPTVGQPRIPQHEQDDEVCVPVTSGLTDRDTTRVEMFYRSRSTEVVVCDCLADLQLAHVQSSGNGDAMNPISNWTSRYIGVPVIVLNTGAGRRKRTLNLVLAERETGFPLWSDRVNYLTNYTERSSTLQSFHVSTSLRTMAAFNFYSAPAAAKFHSHYRRITSDPEDDLWALGHNKKKQKRRNKKNVNKTNKATNWRRSASTKVKKVTKKEISLPCHFMHVTNVNPIDNNLMDVLSDYLLGVGTDGQPLSLLNNSTPIKST